MSEELEKKEVVSNEQKKEEIKKPKKMKTRTMIVLVSLALFILISLIIYRADYIETLEIGEEYLDVFMQNIKYKAIIGVVNFAFVYVFTCITNNLIKKGLKKFFDEEKKEMPKLPNKSLALVLGLVTSIIVSNLFLHKTILFINAAQFGILEPIYNMDVGFYMFQAPLIGQILYYAVAIFMILTAYTVVYYLVVFNRFFEGIDGQTLRNNTFIRQLLFNALLITIFIALIIFFNMQNMVIDGFLTLDDKMETTLIGAGAVDGIKMWGYRIFGIVMILAVYIAIKAFKKNNTSKVIKSLAIVPIYLVIFFVVMVGYNLIFIRGSELDKQKSYIATNIDFTKTAYDLKIDEISLESTGTITEREANEHEDVITNIPVVTEDIAKNNLLQTQTSTGYYTYSKVKAAIYNNKLAYIAARELDSSHRTDEYTHGYGTIITSAIDTDEVGNIKYISRDFEMEGVKEPRIYYGIENNGPIALSDKNQEFDYPKGATQNVTYTYNGEGGSTLNLVDKICVGLREGKLGLCLSGSDSKIMTNRNIIKRAKKIIPYLMYDKEPYLVISDDGELYWILDAYTISNEFPYSQKTKIAYGNETREINYIRNSIKVIINAYDGETNFYITDKTDPIAMVYKNMYSTLFKDGSEIPDGISGHLTYSEFLYNIQAEILNLYHDVSADVLYRANDVWEIASYSSLITRSASTKMKPYYTMLKTVDSDESNLGLVIAYNQYGKESLNAYLVGTVENRKE